MDGNYDGGQRDKRWNIGGGSEMRAFMIRKTPCIAKRSLCGYSQAPHEIAVIRIFCRSAVSRARVPVRDGEIRAPRSWGTHDQISLTQNFSHTCMVHTAVLRIQREEKPFAFSDW
jgi:hypothetical protein